MNGIRIREIHAGGFRPYFQPLRLGVPSRVGQLVTLNPNIQVQVQTGIEQYLLPIGLMAGGVAAFVLGTALPKGVKPVTTISGLGFVAAGIGVLVYRGWKKSGEAAPAAAPAAPPSPSGGVPVGSDSSAPPAFQPPSNDAFNGLQIQVVSPAPDQTISSTGGFLFFGSKKIPIQLRMYNPSNEQVTFNLDFSWDELPAVTGYNRAESHGTYSVQVNLGPNEEKNQTIDLPIQTGAGWTQMQVAFALYKKRTPVERDQLLSNITFTVT